MASNSIKFWPPTRHEDTWECWPAELKTNKVLPTERKKAIKLSVAIWEKNIKSKFFT